MKKKANRNPILPRNKADPVGMGRQVKKLFDDIERRYQGIYAALKKLISSKLREKTVNAESQRSAIVCREFTPEPMIYFVNAGAADYDMTPEEFAHFTDEVQTILEDWLLDEDSSSAFWADVYLDEAQKQATVSVQSSLAQQSELYALNRPLHTVIFSEAYMGRLAIAQQLFYESWRGLTAQTKADLVHTISEAVARGTNIRETAEIISKRLDVSMARAKSMAQTEQLSVYRRAEWAEAREIKDELGLDARILHISALKNTTRRHHASRHGRIFTVDEQEAWYRQGGNRFNCYCKSQVVIHGDTPQSTLDTYAKERKKWLNITKRKSQHEA
ncbi:phage putative head morphogenesis protein, SPP1 gp7 family [Pasteurella testudinis DSM 23072]|uniref:Phage putative head morphogenesis protein, SPP1 gp7 family n=1 Tax=Pasteurella testudinis DSM 23072 TaxID=1122938 RepID=A0A1W1V3V1_9PAST|nr:phage minor head protein [Pasteurella testudinis]SMB87975.1 phage putative head morphogenesis protein, SPP1 gp7 family [Pasteurella testudinis DSM 23072]SUB51628.1 phage head morphogenesis protein, SPP1 gp7 family [Pasteurella testudinis]